MRNFYGRSLWRILPIITLAVVVLAGILGSFNPFGTGAAGTGFATYHDTFYGYSINYPKAWKVTHDHAHTTIFVAPGSQTPCQVSIGATRQATTQQKALTNAVPKGAYSVSHTTISGIPAVSFWQYTQRVQNVQGQTDASTKKVVLAQPNSARGVNLYALSLDLFRSSFMRHNNVAPHTACESNFDVMVNSLSLPKDLNNGLAKAVPGVLTDPNNPAIIYAEGHWSWTYYNHLSSDPNSYYCTSYNINSNQCVPQPNILGTDTPDDGKFDPGYFQPQFQCAEFVTRALAAAGYVPGLDPINSTSDDVASYKGLNLRLVDELLPYLLKIGAVDVGDNPAMAVPGDVVFYDEHVALLIETGTTPGGSDTIVDAHNKDAHRVEYTLGGIAGRHILHLPPLPNFTPNGVILYDHPAYDFSGNTLNFANPGSYTLTTFNDMASSIAIRPGWTVIAYQGSNVSGASALLYKSVPDLRFVYFSNSTTPLDKHISSLLVTNGPPICSVSHSLSTIQTVKSNNSTCQPPPCNDAATFITDVNYPDGTALGAGQSFNKTWRIQNSGNCTWNGYTLNFIDGAQLGGPASVVVPTTSPGQTVGITVPLVAPGSGGTYRGNWQLTDTQGVRINGGGYLWVQISVPYSGNPPPNGGGGDDTLSASYPGVVTPGQHFQPQVTVHLNSGQLLQSRGDMLRNVDGNLYGAWPFVAVVGTVNPGSSYTFTFYNNNPIVAPSGEGTYQSVWQLWESGAWIGPTITITFTVKNGGGTRPNTPALTSPGNWYYARDGSTPQLCASSSSSNIQYDIQIYQGAQTPDSGWINGNCWTPPTLGPYTFTWHAMVRDNSSGLESDWSDGWNFSIASQQLTMDPITFYPPSPSTAEGVQVRSCVHGFGDVNLGLSYEINTATDGSDSGEWHGFSNAGNNCPDPNNPSTWGSFPSLQYADGDHLVRAHGYGPQGQTMIVSAVYHLNHRRPDRAQLLSPIQNVRLNSDTVNFVWNAATNAQSYQLVISANADLSSPLFIQNIGNVTSYQYTFSQDYSPLYWQVIDFNDIGQNSTDITPFGIDRVAPTASVTVLPPKTPDSTFTVTWSGNDADAGIQWYNVQYRDGNAPDSTWVNWQTNTTTTSALFIGEPGHTYYFRAQAMDKATNLGAYAGGDGDTYTLIDLNARPQSPWWDTNYTGKRNAVILNNDPQSLPAGYPIHLHFDANTTPSASDIYNSSLAANKGDDIRIVYQDKTELPRYLANFSSNQVDIWFDLQASIGPNPATDSTNYQIYYSNASAANPPGTINDVIPEGTDANTLGLWHLQEGSGSSISDSSGNGHTGSASNMSWTSGKFGPAGVFNGSNSVVNMGNSTAFNTPTITLEAWVYPTNVGSEQTILRKASDDGSLIYDFLVQGDGVYLRLNGNNGYVRSNTQLQNYRWYHIAATYDGSTIKVYINGNLDNSVSYSVPLRYGTSTNLYLGGDGQFNNKYFFGWIQGARISNVVRTSFPYGSFATILSEPSTNAGSPVVQQTGTPSLAVQSVNVTQGAGGTTMVVVVQNQGSVTTANGFATDLYLNHQPTGPGDYTGSINSWVASPIDANQNITLTTVIPAASNLRRSSANGAPTESSQTFYIQADATGALVAYDQTSQTITGPITVCTASPDAYEGDNSASTAKPITTDGVAQIHNFDTPGDQDWSSFTAQQGMTYTIGTGNLGPNADTVLSLYASDGTTLLASNDDYNGTPASQITWQAPASGTYYVQVTDWSQFVGGCGTTYNLSVTQGASITTTPTSGTYKQSVTVSGNTFAANESIKIYWDSPSTTPLATTTASTTGTLTKNIKVPQAALGKHTLFAIGQTSHRVAIASIQIKPKVSLSAVSGTAGASITLTGYGFMGYTQDVNEVLNVYWNSPTGTLLGTSTVNGLGTSGAITFTVPKVPAGTYTLYAVGQASGATVKVLFKVKPSLTVAPTSGTQGSTATLSGTGYGANETVMVKWNCATSACTSTTVLGTATTDANGNFSLSVTIPAGQTVGTTHNIGAKGGNSNIFVVTHYQVTG